MNHNQYLQRCLELASQGETLAFPNPIVGCVIVHHDQIIGEGFHEYYGGAHAEVNAVTNAVEHHCEERSDEAINTLFKESTIYVSLEPCAHHGKTPPCADLIIKHKFKRLVFSSYDPNPLVSGKGLERIRTAGIEVIEPKDLDPNIVAESDWSHRVFFKMMRQWISHCKEDEAEILTSLRSSGQALQSTLSDIWLTLKVAATAEGNMISKERWITNRESRKAVHRLRSTHQLLITSISTVRADDPEYTVRHSAQELGLRDIRNPDVVILKSMQDFTEQERQTLKIFQKHNRKVFEYHCDKNNPDSLKQFITEMKTQGYSKIMIEAGPTLSAAFLESGLVDEIIHYAPAENNSVEKICQSYEKYNLGKSKIRSQMLLDQNTQQKDIVVII